MFSIDRKSLSHNFWVKLKIKLKVSKKFEKIQFHLTFSKKNLINFSINSIFIQKSDKKIIFLAIFRFPCRKRPNNAFKKCNFSITFSDFPSPWAKILFFINRECVFYPPREHWSEVTGTETPKKVIELATGNAFFTQSMHSKIKNAVVPEVGRYLRVV